VPIGDFSGTGRESFTPGISFSLVGGVCFFLLLILERRWEAEAQALLFLACLISFSEKLRRLALVFLPVVSELLLLKPRGFLSFFDLFFSFLFSQKEMLFYSKNIG